MFSIYQGMTYMNKYNFLSFLGMCCVKKRKQKKKEGKKESKKTVLQHCGITHNSN